MIENKNLLLDLLEELIEAEINGETAEFAEDKTVKAPKYMRDAAKKALEIRDKQPDSNKCCKSPNGKGNSVGLARANQLINNEPLSLKTLKRMKSFGERHKAQATWDEPESKSLQGLGAWGFPMNKAGTDKALKWLSTQIDKLENK